MNFGQIPSGTSVFIDANIFVYDFGPDPVFGPPSRAILKRVETGNLNGFLSALAVSDIAHRLMTLEACQIFGWPFAGIAYRLRSHREEIAKLNKSRKALDDILRMGIHILPVAAQDILTAGDLSRQHNLLSGDGLVIALMQSHHLTCLASNDADFDRVPEITRYAPLQARQRLISNRHVASGSRTLGCASRLNGVRSH